MDLRCRGFSFIVYSVLLCISLSFVFTAAANNRKSSRVYGNDWSTKNVSANSSKRQERFLPFFALVSFPETPCSGDTGEQGICLSRKKCGSAAGTDIGSCAWGYGTCCYLTTTCGSSPSSVTANGTHLVQPTAFKNMCRFEITKQPGVCQIRLDFINFRIEEGSSAALLGNCDTDTLTISGATNGVAGPLCGDLTGQHMYLNYGGTEKINLDLYLEMNSGQTWDIKVTMIKCDSLEKAPDGCLQYFTDQRGTVQSFNFPNMHQLNNQDYTICVKAGLGMKRITWKTCGGTNDFVITGIPPVGTIGNSTSGSMCSLDWVMILGVDKFCGNLFPAAPVTTTTQPFIVQVHFNEFEKALPPPMDCGTMNNPCMGGGPGQNLPMPDDDNSGFCLMYAQSPQ